MHEWNFTTVNDGYTAQAHINHVLKLHSGKMLGGSSSLGHLLYVRGSSHDFDEWVKYLVDKSWSYQNVLYYFKKSQKLDYKDFVYPGTDIFYSTNGEMGVKKLVNQISQKYLNIFKEAGHSTMFDGNRNISLGYYEPMFMIRKGIRQSTSIAFLSPITTRSNLHILKETEATKIYFHNLLAKGVTAVKDGKEIYIKANREVIIAAGTIKSAQLLMLSGIGIKEHLVANGIPLKKDLPVGKFYQDHLAVILVHKFKATKTNMTSYDPREMGVNMIIGNAAVNKLKPYPEYQTLNYIIPSNSDRLLSLCSLTYSFSNEVCNSLYNQTKGFETMFSLIVLLHPKSRGHVALQSKNYQHPPMVISGFYSHEDDMKDVANYLVDFLQIQETPVYKQYGGEFIVPKIEACDNRTGVAYWHCYALNMMVSTYDYASSCSMGQVVDEKLKVYGMSGLRVMDASVIPLLPSGNIQATVMAIGEKGADMVLRDAKHQFPARCD
ncbi:unnamed protein product [Arctia plantaginis]|uniref:Uncharacterized protein n=1 Tax=Arctia plantaginis TaxID=874455 RepID=A0A8S0ZH26_ARCPL|nr:unnamed protein product [Arctia plantaginis]